jgi:hypothetical protein
MAKKKQTPVSPMEHAFMKTIERQKLQDKISENREKIAELGKILNKRPEQKQIDTLTKHNRTLGQKVAITQVEIDRIIVEYEEKARRKK